MCHLLIIGNSGNYGNFFVTHYSHICVSLKLGEATIHRGIHQCLQHGLNVRASLLRYFSHLLWLSSYGDQLFLATCINCFLCQVIVFILLYSFKGSIGLPYSLVLFLKEPCIIAFLGLISKSAFPVKTILQEISKSCKHFSCKTCKILH